MTANKKIYNTFMTWLILFSIIPFVLILILSLFDGNGHFTFANYGKVMDPLYLKLIASSILNAAIITVASCVIVIPLTYLITLQKNRGLWLTIFLIPTWVNLLLKVYAFLGILGSDGIVNQIITALGFNKVNFLFDIKGFLLVTVYIYMPFMMLPLYNSIIKIPKNVVKAAKDLGAKEYEVFFKIVLPLCKNAIASGVILVFIPSLSIFMISRLVTGNKVMTLGTAIEQQFLVTGDWNLGSAIAIVLIIIMLVFNVFMQNIGKWQIRRRDEEN